MQKILLALSLLLIGGAAWQLWPAGEPVAMVAFLDIGQGDAIFIESPTGQQMLVDGGPDPSVLAELSQAMSMFDRSIDVVVATHPDSDHIAGLLSVLETYHVDQVLTTGSTAETDVFQSLYEAVSLEESTVTLVRRGSVIDLGGGMTVEVLFPEQVFDVGDRNVNSLVVMVRYGDTSWLLAGDVGIEQETYLVNEYGAGLQANVLKLGHHGSNSSSAQGFLETVRPELAIISAGENNRYGHPAPEVVERVSGLDIPMLATFEVGTIVTESNGQQVIVK